VLELESVKDAAGNIIQEAAEFSAEGMKAAETNAPMFAHAILTTMELLDQLPAQ